MNKLLIWDIDGTILDCRGCGKKALSYAFEDLYVHENAFSDVDLTGKIDIEVVEGIVNKYKISNFNNSAYFEEYGKKLMYFMKITEGVELIRGVEKVLKEYSNKEHYFLSIATGNCKIGAKIKLSYCGANQYFKTGAYGDEARNRRLLVGVAIENAKRYYKVDFSKENIYYFGDTPKDIEAAKFNKIKSVALSTGFYSYDILKEHRPDYLLTDLTDLKVIEGIFE
ncbi:MAG: HAD hydrolase-like protein [Clostridiales bacterium]|nr:HAD hydrolase-like protein [Clostridiales bacterium]